MIVEITEALWLDECHEFSLTQFVELSGLSAAELRHLVDCEALTPVATARGGMGAPEACFSAECLALARSASRLRRDFELDEDALLLTLRLLTRIQELEVELLDLRARLPQSATKP